MWDFLVPTLDFVRCVSQIVFCRSFERVYVTTHQSHTLAFEVGSLVRRVLCGTSGAVLIDLFVLAVDCVCCRDWELRFASWLIVVDGFLFVLYFFSLLLLGSSTALFWGYAEWMGAWCILLGQVVFLEKWIVCSEAARLYFYCARFRSVLALSTCVLGLAHAFKSVQPTLVQPCPSSWPLVAGRQERGEDDSKSEQTGLVFFPKAREHVLSALLAHSGLPECLASHVTGYLSVTLLRSQSSVAYKLGGLGDQVEVVFALPEQEEGREERVAALLGLWGELGAENVSAREGRPVCVVTRLQLEALLLGTDRPLGDFFDQQSCRTLHALRALKGAVRPPRP